MNVGPTLLAHELYRIMSGRFRVVVAFMGSVLSPPPLFSAHGAQKEWGPPSGVPAQSSAPPDLQPSGTRGGEEGLAVRYPPW
ncbi:hypothetical protein CRG98_007388 [Punica granatum]|uniref:Uncharacterized protein n=1 Tax=Punica granatum TaxID=22663 RepID=A0A2I0KV37_PUNGR|nr:hypothetical protein CRG98_007388 [Punica granatum]